MTPKVADSPKNQHVSSESREHSSRLSALSNFSIGDMFRDVRDGSKSVKFPEKLLKVLEQKLQNIAMGKEAACVFSMLQFYLSLIPDQLLGSTCAADNGQILRPVYGGYLQAPDEGE